MTERYRESREYIAPELEREDRDSDIFGVVGKISQRIEVESEGKKAQTQVLLGFEDVIDEPLGSGLFYNTIGSIYQLGYAISLSLHPSVTRLKQSRSVDPQETIRELRNNQVLSGLKIIDLGCGVPKFAIVAHALGAEVYTADAEDIWPEYKEKIRKHIELDLNDSGASQLLLRETEGNFDLVTENVVGTVPGGARFIVRPTDKNIQTIAATLLKQGGHLHQPNSGMNRVYRKK